VQSTALHHLGRTDRRMNKTAERVEFVIVHPSLKHNDNRAARAHAARVGRRRSSHNKSVEWSITLPERGVDGSISLRTIHHRQPCQTIDTAGPGSVHHDIDTRPRPVTAQAGGTKPARQRWASAVQSASHNASAVRGSPFSIFDTGYASHIPTGPDREALHFSKSASVLIIT
jgi:hypothetical protein